MAQPSAAPANDVDQLAGALHGQSARSNEQCIIDLREPARGSPGSVIHAIAVFFAPPNYRPVSVISTRPTAVRARSGRELLRAKCAIQRQGALLDPLFCLAVTVPAGFDSGRSSDSSASLTDCSVLHSVQSHGQLFRAIEYLRRAAHLQLSPTTNGRAGSPPAGGPATPHELCWQCEMRGRHSSGTKSVT